MKPFPPPQSACCLLVWLAGIVLGATGYAADRKPNVVLFMATHQFAQSTTHELYRDGRYFDLTRDWCEEKPPLSDAQLSGRDAAEARKLQAVLDRYANARPKHLAEHVASAGATIHNPYWPTWMATAGENPRTYQLVRRYMRRPAEELYHTAADPAEMTNLAGKPEHAAIQQKLSAELDRWLAAQNDPGLWLDTVEAHAAAKRGQHSFSTQPSTVSAAAAGAGGAAARKGKARK
jgi:hypothetical protein